MKIKFKAGQVESKNKFSHTRMYVAVEQEKQELISTSGLLSDKQFIFPAFLFNFLHFLKLLGIYIIYFFFSKFSLNICMYALTCHTNLFAATVKLFCLLFCVFHAIPFCLCVRDVKFFTKINNFLHPIVIAAQICAVENLMKSKFSIG